MSSEPKTPEPPDRVEMPRPTAAPFILAVGFALLGAGVALSLALSAVGAVLLLVGLGTWIAHLLPGRGHHHEERSGLLPATIRARPGTVEQLQAGKPGYRMRLPTKVHPISAGIKGGIVGGLLMPIPALIWGLTTGHGIWYPVNLLAGVLLTGVEDLAVTELQKFHPGLLLVGIVIHVVMSLVIGLIYGVLLPTLPPIPGGQLIWGGALLPMVWTGASYGLMGVVNPALQKNVDWPWFVASQFVFGLAAAVTVIRTETVAISPAGRGPDTEPLVAEEPGP